MQTLSLMPGDNFKVGDYVYIVNTLGISQEAIGKKFIDSVHFKKKLSIQDRINIKLGIPLLLFLIYLSFSKVSIIVSHILYGVFFFLPISYPFLCTAIYLAFTSILGSNFASLIHS